MTAASSAYHAEYMSSHYTPLLYPPQTPEVGRTSLRPPPPFFIYFLPCRKWWVVWVLVQRWQGLCLDLFGNASSWGVVDAGWVGVYGPALTSALKPAWSWILILGFPACPSRLGHLLQRNVLGPLEKTRLSLGSCRSTLTEKLRLKITWSNIAVHYW